MNLARARFFTRAGIRKSRARFVLSPNEREGERERERKKVSVSRIRARANCERRERLKGN